MIKEKGGFDKFDISKPKFKLVDMDKLNKQTQQAMMSDNESMSDDNASIPADLGLTPNNNEVYTKRELITASSAMDESIEPSHGTSTNNDDDFDIHGLRYNSNFGQDGPMMM